VADDPERHRDGDDIPEEALGTGPLAAAAEDQDRHERRRGDQARIPEDRRRKRVPFERPPD
jgi:hypothetical protein